MRNPWVGLRPFATSDSDLFFGRDREVQILGNLVATLPVLIVYAPSGTGKSSLINAGVAPRILEDRTQVLALVSDPHDDVLSRTRTSLHERGWTAPDGLGLADLLERHWVDTDRRTVIFVDQFEERLNAALPTDDLYDAIARMTHAGTDAGCIVLSIREDYLGSLEPLMQRVPGLLNGSYRVPALSRDALEAAIYGPLRTTERSVSVDPELVSESLDDLDRRSTRRQEPNEQRFEPGYFQVVWSTLWDHSAAAEDGASQLTLSDYEELGRADRILKDFTSKTLDSLEPAHAEVFWAISRYLVLPTGAKVALTVEDLTQLLQQFDYIPSVADHDPQDGDDRSSWLLGLTLPSRASLIRQVLQHLTSSRAPLFQRVIRSDREEFELLHDLLGTIVLAWRQDYEYATLAIRRDILDHLAHAEVRLDNSSTRTLREGIEDATRQASAYPDLPDAGVVQENLRISVAAVRLMSLRTGIARHASFYASSHDIEPQLREWERAWRGLCRRGVDDPSEAVRRSIQELVAIWRPSDFGEGEPVYETFRPWTFRRTAASVVVWAGRVLAAAAIAYLVVRATSGGLGLHYTALTLVQTGVFFTAIGAALGTVSVTDHRWRFWRMRVYFLPLTWPFPVVLAALAGVAGAWVFELFGWAPTAGFNLSVLYASLVIALAMFSAVDT